MKNKKGFSILELIIAIFVLVIGIVGVLQLIVASMRETIDVRKHLVASELAQEGLELVRNLRDNSLLAGATFSATYGFPATGANFCKIDLNEIAGSLPVLECGVSPDNKIYLGANYYRQKNVPGIAQTSFRRNIKIEYGLSPSGYQKWADVTSTVWWGGGSAPDPCNLGSQCISSQSRLTNR